MTKHTDFNGKATGYSYNASQQLATLSYPDKRAISYSYDALGNVAKVSDSLTGDLDYTYDLLGRITQVSSALGQLAYGWDANGNKVSQQINTQGSFSYGYDALNRLSSIIAMDGSVTRFEYDKVGNRTKINRSNGTQSVMTYNKANQLTSITHQKSSTVLAKFVYTLDENGRRIQVDESIDGVQRSVSYQYDATGKLLTETILQAGQRSSIAYTYDAMGNRLTKGITTNYSYNRNDQIISETTAGIITSYAWDSNGNLLKKTSCDGVVSYSWSSSNKLLSIDDQVNQRQVSYQYDGQDNRIGKVVKQNGQSIETKYLVDSERPYSEVVLERSRIDQGNWSETVYLHTPEGLGDLLTQDQTGQVNHLYQDAQGSTRLVTNKQGPTQSTFAYDAFGNALLSSKPNDTIKHRYVGESLDQDSGFYHLRARDYDPKIGRFVSRDSFEGIRNNPITLNPYLYSNADPVNSVDPSGYFSLGNMMTSIGNMAINASMAYARMEIADMIGSALLSHIIDNFISSSTSLRTVLPAGNMLMTSIVSSLGTMCAATSGKKCYIKKVPLMSTGFDLKEHSIHILEATTGNGNTINNIGQPLSVALIRKSPPHPRTGWYNSKPGCKGRGKGLVCDEYPYNSTYNGGKANYEAGMFR